MFHVLLQQMVSLLCLSCQSQVTMTPQLFPAPPTPQIESGFEVCDQKRVWLERGKQGEHYIFLLLLYNVVNFNFDVRQQQEEALQRGAVKV